MNMKNKMTISQTQDVIIEPICLSWSILVLWETLIYEYDDSILWRTAALMAIYTTLYTHIWISSK